MLSFRYARQRAELLIEPQERVKSFHTTNALNQINRAESTRVANETLHSIRPPLNSRARCPITMLVILWPPATKHVSAPFDSKPVGNLVYRDALRRLKIGDALIERVPARLSALIASAWHLPADEPRARS